MTAVSVATAADAAMTTAAVAVTNLPDEFCARIRTQTEIPDPEGLLDALASGSPSVAIRHNRLKGCAPAPGADVVPWCPQGEYLTERAAFTFDPAFHQGLYYVQDPSSMSIAAAIESLRLPGPVAYLDACAAPGGKTTAAIDALPAGSFVLANEFEPARAAVLRDNIIKWGVTDVAVSCGPAQRLAALGRDTFDVIAADVPCSGEGMMRKDPVAVRQWTPRLVAQCAALQRDIVAALWPMLRPGGYMIYSTCTFSREENEDNVQWLIDEYGAEQLPTPFPAHFYPHQFHGEGLYMAVLRKPGVLSPNPKVNLRKIASSLILNGLERYELKGKDRIPTWQWAMAADYPRSEYPEVEVTRADALRYLHRDSLTLPSDTPRGFVLLTYGSRPLGFVKNLGSRANNLLPKHLRILSDV